MASIRKSNSLYKHSCDKYRSHTTSNISLDTSRLSIRMNDTNSYENTPSPSSIGSTSTNEQSPKYRHRILSSTLKNDHMSIKRRSRYDKLFHYTQTINRQYMITMTNILFQMQKEIYKLKRRTHRVEQLVIKQTKSVQPIIRIPRLTKDQLSTICINNNTNNEIVLEENDPISNNNDIKIIENTKSKTTKAIKRLKQKHKNTKKTLSLSKKTQPHIWINNRQKPIDPSKYCSLCRHEFSRRSNYLIHIKKIHKGKIPPIIDDEDQSLLEMNEESIEKNFDQHNNNHQNETTNDQSVVIDDEIESLQGLTNQWDISDGRLRPRSGSKSKSEHPTHAKAKCDICNKIYRMDYMKRHKIRAHPDQEILLSSELNNNSEQLDLLSNKTIDQYHLSNENPKSIDEINTQNANTPATITIAEMDIDDVPIRFRADSSRTIVIAVTCLESYQMELVEQFVQKFSSYVCQTTSVDSRTTHLITNDEQHSLRSPLSMKLIEAIAHHCFCVSYRWIIDCLKYDRIIDEESYEIEGDDTDIHPHGGPRRARLMSTRHSLFQNICFMIKCTENSDIRMTNERLEDLITTCGGQIITCVTQRLLDKYQIIVLCDMLYVSERRHNYDQCRSLGIQFVSSDWVLESILEYRQKPFQLFEEVPL